MVYFLFSNSFKIQPFEYFLPFESLNRHFLSEDSLSQESVESINENEDKNSKIFNGMYILQPKSDLL